MEQDTGVSAEAAGLLSDDGAASVSTLRASIPNATVTERSGDFVTLFTIRVGWEWASIFVRPFDGGAEVVAHSTFGTYGHIWGAMGVDWRDFLVSCSREYAMRKLASHAYDIPLDRDEFIDAMRREVKEYEESITEAWGIVDSDQARRLSLCREALDDEWGWDDVPLDALFWHFNEKANGAPYAMELYEARLTKINPQIVGFWDTIWAPFVAHLAQGMSPGTAETGTGSGPQDGQPGSQSECAHTPSATPNHGEKP